MGVYDAQAATALRLITEKGRSIQIRRWPAEPDGTPSQPWRREAGAIENHDAVGVFLDAQRSFVDGTTIDRENTLVLVAAKDLAVVPALGDGVVAGSKVHHVKEVRTLAPNGEQIIHELEVVR